MNVARDHEASAADDEVRCRTARTRSRWKSSCSASASVSGLRCVLEAAAQGEPEARRSAGFIIDPAGWIVTNHHVAGKAERSS